MCDMWLGMKKHGQIQPLNALTRVFFLDIQFQSIEINFISTTFVEHFK